jgi:hypothetical protein
MIAPSSVPNGGRGASYVELRCSTAGSAFHIEGRWRVLRWYQDPKGRALPEIATGRVAYRAFLPNARDPSSAFGFVEVRAPGCARRWWSPVWPDLQPDDAKLKRVFASLAERAARTR